MDVTLLIISQIFVLLSVILIRLNNSNKVIKPIFSLLFIISIILSIIYVVSNYFSDNGFDESVIYHLQYGLSGAGFTEYKLPIFLSSSIILFTILFSMYIHRNKKHTRKSLKFDFITFIAMFLSIFFNPITKNIYSLYYTPNEKNLIESDSTQLLHIPSYSHSTEDSTVLSWMKNEKTDFFKYYKIPSIEPIIGDSSKNLIVIYLESFERTYFDNKLFPKLTPNLHKIEERAVSFTNIKQVYSTKWTIAGMVAGQCGIPLFTSSHANSMSGMDSFLPTAKSLGDLLKEQGYYLTFMGGADHNFAGKGKFYKTHCFDEVLGRDELLPLTKDSTYKNGWGLFDDALFELSFAKFEKLAQEKNRFGLFLLTSDTHHPNGHASKSVRNSLYNRGDNSMLNVITSSDKLVSDFVKKIEHSPHFKNTIIVLVSDHLAMNNGCYDQLKKGTRRNLFMVLHSDSAYKVDKPGSVLDIGSTILPFIGFKGNIGLGRNLLDSNVLTSELKTIQKKSNLKRWKKPITNFWTFPKIEKEITFDKTKAVVKIDSREFNIPALIEIEKDLSTTMKFEFFKEATLKSLDDHLKALPRDKAYILIKKSGKNGFKVTAGYKSRVKLNTILTDSLIITQSEVSKLFN